MNSKHLKNLPSIESRRDVTLVIETAIGGGSLAVFRDRRLVDESLGREGVSKAEDVLDNVEDLLKKNSIKKNELNLIRVSSGPGSSTGLKIGLSIARGLSDALKISCVETSAAQALLKYAISENSKAVYKNTKKEIERMAVILPVGKKTIEWCLYERSDKVDFEEKDRITMRIEASDFIEQFHTRLVSNRFERLIFHPAAFGLHADFESLRNIFDLKLLIAPGNLAVLIGEIFASDNAGR